MHEPVTPRLMTRTWMGRFLGFLWSGVLRSSVCHLWGARPFNSHDESRNNVIVGILGMGEGWHNTYHAFPNPARHGLSWWQLDLSYWLIR